MAAEPQTSVLGTSLCVGGICVRGNESEVGKQPSRV